MGAANPDAAFVACVTAVQTRHVGSGPPPIQASNEQKLELYGLYKQAMLGDNNLPAPWVWQLTEHAKWSAWRARRGMSKSKAKSEYVRAVRRLLPPIEAPIANADAARVLAQLRRVIAKEDQQQH
jgi:diazepam-binding inhibitor (GABA receptor modulating acyl-CoA-binding protein)